MMITGHRYFIHLAFDGSGFNGWQRQKNGTTIQQVIEEALTMMLKEPVKLTGAGRTDAGVHARNYFAHFDFGSLLKEEEREKLVFRLNSYLDPRIVVYRIAAVRNTAHARFSALSRTYQYYINTVKDPFLRRFSYYFYGPMDVELMNTGAGMITGKRDFSSFSKTDTDTRTNICTVTVARWEKTTAGLVFTIAADRFLRNMVRAVVGTLIQLGMGKINLADIDIILESRNRSSAGESVPAHGLFLQEIRYPDDIWT